MLERQVVTLGAPANLPPQKYCEGSSSTVPPALLLIGGASGLRPRPKHRVPNTVTAASNHSPWALAEPRICERASGSLADEKLRDSTDPQLESISLGYHCTIIRFDQVAVSIFFERSANVGAHVCFQPLPGLFRKENGLSSVSSATALAKIDKRVAHCCGD